MGELTEATRAPAPGTTCLDCGIELGRFSSGVEELCVACSARVLTQDAPVAPVNGHRQETPQLGELSLPRANRSREALAELIAKGPSTAASALMSEVLETDKRVSWLIALVPFAGPWLIQRSETHSAKEKFWLTWMSISLTVLVLFGMLSTLPSRAEGLENLHQRIDTEMKALADFAQQYRVNRGSYPDKPTWKRFADRADPRFFDPWGRPYRYEPSISNITIETLGRNGVEGGSDEDADLSKRFYPTKPSQPAR